MRIVRFCGGAHTFWPIGLHSMVVADLLPAKFAHHGLLHDSAEVCVSDIPRPMKTASQRTVEHNALARIYASLGVTLPTEEEQKLIHEADIKAVLAEGLTDCAPRGFCETQTGFRREPEAIEKMKHYLVDYKPEDAINPDGRWPIEFEKRLRRALRDVHRIAYNVPA